MDERIRVGICDDDGLVAAALRAYVSAAPDLEVVGVFSSGPELLNGLGACPMDVLLLDVRMPHMSGREVAGLVAARRLGVAVLYLTSYPMEVPVEDALDGVVAGALTKDITPRDLATSIRAAHAGITLLSPAVRDRVTRPTDGRIRELAQTDREEFILRLAAQGLSNADIAQQLHVSESTVKQSMSGLARRAGVDSRLALVLHVSGLV